MDKPTNQGSAAKLACSPTAQVDHALSVDWQQPQGLGDRPCPLDSSTGYYSRLQCVPSARKAILQHAGAFYESYYSGYSQISVTKETKMAG